MERGRQATLSETERAIQYALRVLGYRARSAAEMRTRLARKGFAAGAIEHTLARLIELGLLDDRDCALGVVAARRGFGTARLKQSLRQKGIDRDLAEEVLTGFSTEDEAASAWQVATRALRATPLPPAIEAILRLRRMLHRRGFSSAVISRVCARLGEQSIVEGDWLE